MSKRTLQILLIFFFIFFTCYEIVATRSEDESVSMYGISSFFPYLIFIILFTVLLAVKREINRLITWPLLFLTSFLYILLLFWFLFYPLASNLILITITFPIMAYAFMYNVKIREISDNLIFICLVISILSLVFYYFQNYTIDILRSSTNGGLCFAIVFLIPFILCIKRWYIKFPLMVISAFVVFMSMKRGCILSLTVCIFIYFLVNFILNTKRNYIVLLLVTIFVGFVFYFSYSYADDVLDNRLTQRFDDTTGSGRDEIYMEVWSMFNNSSFLNKMLGHGWDGVSRDLPSHLSAHNDYLEILYDLGVLFLLFYVLFLIHLISYSIKLIRYRVTYASQMTSSVVMLIVTSMISHVYYYPYYFMIYTMFWGYIHANVKLELYNSSE